MGANQAEEILDYFTVLDNFTKVLYEKEEYSIIMARSLTFVLQS